MENKIIKPVILLIGCEEYLKEGMLTTVLKQLTESYDLLFAHFPTNALHEIANAKLIKKQPIHGLIFNRTVLVVNSVRCKFIFELAEHYSEKGVVAINMILNDQDGEARNRAVSADYCKVNDWNRVKTILDNRHL
jgi:hypothetical protein